MPSRKSSQQAQKVRKISSSRKVKAEHTIERIRGLENEIGTVLQSMQEKVRQLEYLTQFSSLMNSTLDPEIVREKALEATCKLLGCETASLLLVDKKTGELYYDGQLVK